MTVELGFVVHPGEYVEEWLEENSMTQAELARRLGCSRKHVSEIVSGKKSLSPDMAQKLSFVTGTPAWRWLQLQAFHDENAQRVAIDEAPDEARELLKLVPVTELRALGLISSSRREVGRCASEVMRFFQVGSLAVLRTLLSTPPAVAFRNGNQGIWAARITWLRLVELQADRFDLDHEFDRDVLAGALEDMRSWSRLHPADFGNRLRDVFAQAGVRLLFVPAVPRAGTYGVTRWYKGAPTVALSLHRRTDDQFWFTLFHEVHHVLNDKLTPQGFVSGPDETDIHEEAADAFARNLLIPQEFLEEMRGLKSDAQVEVFAAKLGIAPGIVVGRLRREQLWLHSQGHSLLKSLVVSST